MKTFILAHRTNRQEEADVTYVVADTEDTALAVFDKRYGEQDKIVVLAEYDYVPFGAIQLNFPKEVHRDSLNSYVLLKVVDKIMDGVYTSIHRYYSTDKYIQDEDIEEAYPNSEVVRIFNGKKGLSNVASFFEPNTIEIYSPEYIEYYGITGPIPEDFLYKEDTIKPLDRPAEITCPEDVIRGLLVKKTPVEDPVNDPKHYDLGPFKTLDVIQTLLTPEQYEGFLLGNMVKYRCRAGKKGDSSIDLKKADYYENLYDKEYKNG